MTRIALYLAGVSGLLAALAMYARTTAESNRRQPIRQMADQLRDAWTDHHTTG